MTCMVALRCAASTTLMQDAHLPCRTRCVRMACCVLCVVCCVLCVVCCVLCVVHCVLCVVHCVLCVVRCTLCVVCCVLCVARVCTYGVTSVRVSMHCVQVLCCMLLREVCCVLCVGHSACVRGFCTRTLRSTHPHTQSPTPGYLACSLHTKGLIRREPLALTISRFRNRGLRHAGHFKLLRNGLVGIMVGLNHHQRPGVLEQGALAWCVGQTHLWV